MNGTDSGASTLRLTMLNMIADISRLQCHLCGGSNPFGLVHWFKEWLDDNDIEPSELSEWAEAWYEFSSHVSDEQGYPLPPMLENTHELW